METVLRTTLILLAAFLVGQVTPPGSVVIPAITLIVVTAGIIDFGLYIRTGSGLLSHLQNK